MSSFYNIEQKLLTKFNLPTKWADYDEELDEIYMKTIHPILMKHFQLSIEIPKKSQNQFELLDNFN